ncbi:MAG: radical SAM protein [Clostridia bacterium]|nr:radical SAM protein [Clostridia bacterium]
MCSAALSGTEAGRKAPIRIQEKQCRSILTASRLPGGGYSANPYTGCEHACRYCYASYMSKFSGHTERWGTYVDVKQWESAGRLERLRDKPVFLSSVTDPYQPAETVYGRTRALLEELAPSGCRLSVVTKSDLAVRDLDLISQFPDAVVAWSVNTLDEEFRQDMDAAASIGSRLEAMRAFHEAGVRTACFAAPIFPGITDLEALFEALRGRADEVWLDRLNLRGPSRQVILRYIREKWPGLLPLYEAIYLEGDPVYWAQLDRVVSRLEGRLPFKLRSFIGHRGAGG